MRGAQLHGGLPPLSLLDTNVTNGRDRISLQHSHRFVQCDDERHVSLLCWRARSSAMLRSRFAYARGACSFFRLLMLLEQAYIGAIICC